MKIPKQIKIGGKLVDIKLVSGEEHFPDGATGMAFFKRNIIKIDSDQTEAEQWSTLLHEWLEFVKSMNELELKHQDLCILEVALYQFLKDNKINL